jgi:type II secretory pathway pseudopilin PulG
MSKSQTKRGDFTRPGRRGNEAGDTLIEILITLLIMSVAGVALISAFSTSISATSEYRGLSVSDTVLRSVSEQVIGLFQAGGLYEPCATYLYYESTIPRSSLVAPPPYSNNDYQAKVVDVTYWDATTSSFGTSCTAGSTAPQTITIQLSGPLVVPELISFIVEGSGQIFTSGSGNPLDPPTNVMATCSACTDSGGLVISFTGSLNAPPTTSTFTQYYSVKACTNRAMTFGCTPLSTNFESGMELTGVVPGTTYWVTVFANASPGYLASQPSAPVSGVSSGTVSNPAVTSVSPSQSTAGALDVVFTPLSPNGEPIGETYTVSGCTDSAMTKNCSSQAIAKGGGALTGLTPAAYYVTVSADPNGNYTGTTSLIFSPPVKATVQLGAPSGVTAVGSSTQVGAIVVSFTAPSNAPSGQTYLLTVCSNQGMSLSCQSEAAVPSGSVVANLTAGSRYWATVTAVLSTGYLAATSAAAGPAVAAIPLAAPTNVSVKPGSTGDVIVTFTLSNNAAQGQTYTLVACQNSSMKANCTTISSYSPGSNVGSWPSGKTIFVTVTANASPGYVASSPSSQASGSSG